MESLDIKLFLIDENLLVIIAYNNNVVFHAIINEAYNVIL